jgi:membrane protein YdbS with pleckstrin-like domain
MIMPVAVPMAMAMAVRVPMCGRGAAAMIAVIMLVALVVVVPALMRHAVDPFDARRRPLTWQGTLIAGYRI